MSIPNEFNISDDLPEYTEPARAFDYTLCAECGERAWDPIGEFCSACDAAISLPPISLDDRARALAEIDQAKARWDARRHQCEYCDNLAVIESEYPIRSDYDGQLLGSMKVQRCVPCHNAHHENGPDEAFGVPSALRYV